jgi:hypothetical protein
MYALKSSKELFNLTCCTWMQLKDSSSEMCFGKQERDKNNMPQITKTSYELLQLVPYIKLNSTVLFKVHSPFHTSRLTDDALLWEHPFRAKPFNGC